MERKVETNISQPAAQVTWYKPDTLAGKLERLLQEEGTAVIGDMEYRTKKYTRPDGEIRPGGLDMEAGERAYRTYCIKQLTKPGLDKVHAKEQAKMDRFLLRSEMEKVSREVINPVQFTQDQREYAINFNNEHRPLIDREYKGFKIPPYFIYDAEFDGMDWHHAVDLCVWYAQWELPLGGGRGRLSGEFR